MCGSMYYALKLDVKSVSLIKVLIVVVTYNCERYVDYIIDSLRRQMYDLSNVLLIVVDNASRDNTLVRMLSYLRKFDRLNWLVIRLSRNYGFALANNVALHLAKKLLGSLDNRVVIFLNPDIWVFNRYFLRYAELLTSSFPIVGFAMVSGNYDIIDSLGSYVDYLGKTQDILYGVKLSSRLIKLIKHLPLLYTVPYVCFAAVAIRGEVLESLGFLRSFYVIYAEDVEYCLRAWSRGIPVLVCRKFMIWHARGGTRLSAEESRRMRLKSNSLDVSFHSLKNSLLFAYEYLGVVKFLMRVITYLTTSILSRRKKPVRALWETLKIIKKKRIKPKRLPKHLVPSDPKTWKILWYLKCLLQKPVNMRGFRQEYKVYGAQRASFEYLRYRFLKANNISFHEYVEYSSKL